MQGGPGTATATSATGHDWGYPCVPRSCTASETRVPHGAAAAAAVAVYAALWQVPSPWCPANRPIHDIVTTVYPPNGLPLDAPSSRLLTELRN